MTEDEFKAIDQRLADMSERCDRVIAKQSRGKRMPVLDFKPRSLPQAGHYLAESEPLMSRGARYVPESEDCIEQIFADFERQFDEMAQAHRYRA